MTTPAERSGALEAVERIVNRGDDVVAGTLRVLEPLFGPVELTADGIDAGGATDEDRALLERVTTLISAHLPAADAQPPSER